MRALVVIALLAACRGHGKRDEVNPQGSASSGSAAMAVLVPKLPPSPDPLLEVQGIDVQISRTRDDPRAVGHFLAVLLERTQLRGDLEDYQEALARSARWVSDEPGDAEAWAMRVQVLVRVHQFAAARQALEHRKKLARDPSEWQELAASIDEATGQLDRSQPVRDELVSIEASTGHLVQRANGLALAGKLDDALALMPKAAAALHDNAPELIAWIYFQWGRLYEQKGELAAARDFYAAARERLPTLEATTHLAQTMAATGDRDGARKLVEAELAQHRHPELLALAVELGHHELAGETRDAWERYVAALPEAFADHAARYYIATGHDAPRALELARANLANRDTRESRALVVEAALAAGDAKTACAVATPLAAPTALRSERFVAWKALSACGRKEEAEQLARDLKITP